LFEAETDVDFCQQNCHYSVSEKLRPKTSSRLLRGRKGIFSDRTSLDVLEIGSGGVDELLTIKEAKKGKGLDWSVDGRAI
jgi:hypothetical protein